MTHSMACTDDHSSIQPRRRPSSHLTTRSRPSRPARSRPPSASSSPESSPSTPSAREQKRLPSSRAPSRWIEQEREEGEGAVHSFACKPCNLLLFYSHCCRRETRARDHCTSTVTDRRSMDSARSSFSLLPHLSSWRTLSSASVNEVLCFLFFLHHGPVRRC
jgi:hypothetical protein